MERNTTQRRAIRRIFENAERPLSPAEVHATARTMVTRLGIATVYRALKDLLDEGWLTTVEIPGEAPRYEIAGRPPHPHFLCRRCGGVFEVSESMARAYQADAAAQDRFRIEGVHVLYFGMCAHSCEPRVEMKVAGPTAKTQKGESLSWMVPHAGKEPQTPVPEDVMASKPGSNGTH